MRLLSVLTIALVTQVGWAAVRHTAPNNEKVKPFIEVLTLIGDTSDNLRDAVTSWSGGPLDAAPILANATLLTKALATGVERVQRARRLHAASELRLRRPARRVAAATFDTLQVFALNERRFREAAASNEVRHVLATHREGADRLNEAMCGKMGPIGCRATRRGGDKARVWFEEVEEIYAKPKDKRPEEDARRRRSHPKWRHIRPPPPDME